jgi:hypothetical protein
MGTATTTVTAGKAFAVETASMELRDDGTGNSKHLMKNAKKRAKRSALVVKIRKAAPRS